MPPERRTRPLASHIAALLDNVERLACRRFFDGVLKDDAEEMIKRAYDEGNPIFLRGPIMETLNDGMQEFFPGLKPSGVDDEGRQVFNLADLAEALGTREEDLLAHAEKMGLKAQLRTTSPNPLH
ncbi:hypothetical protein [Halomonas litopenaei]|uniref:hypothetical protein n=1 Tax=Halomonas litopenaei TaxID=2109328 RepID=UPI001A8DB8AB|nr:hypothetical protein [Halomonas litopenaei]MBN8412995.1 hypothetical protein [Halomonas litopenaei]